MYVLYADVYVDVCMCFRQTITLSIQNATAQGPDGE